MTVQVNGDYNTRCIKTDRDVVIPAITKHTKALIELFEDPSNVIPVNDRKHLGFFAGGVRGFGAIARTRIGCGRVGDTASQILYQKFSPGQRYLGTLNSAKFCLLPRGIPAWYVSVLIHDDVELTSTAQDNEDVRSNLRRLYSRVHRRSQYVPIPGHSGLLSILRDDSGKSSASSGGDFSDVRRGDVIRDAGVPAPSEGGVLVQGGDGVGEEGTVIIFAREYENEVGVGIPSRKWMFQGSRDTIGIDEEGGRRGHSQTVHAFLSVTFSRNRDIFTTRFSISIITTFHRQRVEKLRNEPKGNLENAGDY